ncbi:MAG: arylesterase [Oscillospiraceae bacterium]|nr:arylesterase [Oscillospiraceae bacterium]
MKSILAFGDSNTWGLIPGSKERYPWTVRWTGALERRSSSLRVMEEGLCGRTTAFEDDLRPGRRGASALPMILESHHPLDAAVVMLGTNDCKRVYSASEDTIGKGMELCLDELEKYLPPRSILLVSPIWLGEEVWKPDKDPEFGARSVLTCRRLKEVYGRIAKERGTAFLAASDYVLASEADEEHMDAEGHRIFAAAVYEKLREMNAV